MIRFLNLKFKIGILLVFLFSPIMALADRSSGGEIRNFDVQPRTIDAGQQVSFNFRILVYGGTPSAFLTYCGVASNTQRDIDWRVFERLGSGQERIIEEGEIFYNPFTYANLTRDISFDKVLPDLAGPRTFFGQIRCITNRDPISGSVMATSAGVTITQNPGQGGNSRNPGADFSFPNPLRTQTIFDLIDAIIGFAYRIGLPIAVAVIVYSGILFLWARGSPTTITKARTILMYAVIGLAILFIGKGFLTLIESILNLGT